MTLGCAEREEMLAAYVDGELAADEAEAFVLHLADCAACQAGLHDLLQLAALEPRIAGGAGAADAIASSDGIRPVSEAEVGRGDARGDGAPAAGDAPSTWAVASSDAIARAARGAGDVLSTLAGASSDASARAGRGAGVGDVPSTRARASSDAIARAARGAGAGDVPSTQTRAPAARRRWASVGVALAAAAAAVIGVVALRGRGDRGGAVTGAASAPIALATAEARSVEGRISYAAADRHRRYSVVRAGSAAPDAAPGAGDRIALDTLATLERRGDLHGIAAAYLLLGDAQRAESYLARAAAGPDVAADRALIQLAAGKPADAVIGLAGVLDAAPHHPQALWNRALALRDLGLPRMAIEAFRAVAELGEPGWADEARTRADALAAQTDERQHLAEQLLAAGPKLAAAPGGISVELARRIPGTARLYFYDAVRGAATAGAVRALAPLAGALDAAAGGRALTDYVERTARADFSRRGPLAARYAKIVAGERLDAAAARDLLAALRAAHLDDILLGALLLTAPDRRTVPPALLPEFRRLADAAGDPWFPLLAIEQQALARAAQGDHAGVEQLVRPALAACGAGGVDFRCTRLDFVLGASYLELLRLSDARRTILDGLARATRSGEWWLEQRLLPQLATLETVTDDIAASRLPVARAYLGELVHRDPRCSTEVWSREGVAMMLLNRGDDAAARGELARAVELAAGCAGRKPDLGSVFVAAHLAGDDRVAAVRAEIAALRGDPAIGPGGKALLDESEGMLLLERDRAAGVALLERAIAAARPIAAGDVDAHKARSYAYSLLVLDAARAGDWPRAWQLLGDEVGAAIERCGLGIAIEGRRGAVIVRDADGALAGGYDAARATAETDAAHAVPGALRERLRGCAEIRVIARPPIQGSPAVLPPELAWSYRSARSAAAAGAGSAAGEAPADSPASTGGRLVIFDAAPPAELGLARLAPWRSSSRPDAELGGAAATPARALAAMAGAGFVEIHAHGMVNAAVSDASFLMLSPDPDGRYALTAAEIRKQPLRGRPIVVLAACHAGATASYRHQPWGLAAAFVEAGARAVIASPDVIADADAGAVFDAIRAAIAGGASPAVALRDVRVAWLAAHPDAGWLRSVMVFQ